jgi:hypothetical protein
MVNVEALVQLEEVLGRVRELKHRELSNYWLAGPYLGVTLGATLGAVQCLQRALQGRQAALAIVRGVGTFGLAGLVYAATGHILTKQSRTDNFDVYLHASNGENSNNNDIAVDIRREHKWQVIRNRFLAGLASGGAVGAVRQSGRLALGTALAVGIVAAGDAMINTLEPFVDDLQWRARPVEPPTALNLRPK